MGSINIIGFKTVKKKGTKFFFCKYFVLCKICAKHENCILNHNVHGTTKDAVETIVTDTGVVTKFNVSIFFSKKVFKHALSRHIRKRFFLIALNILILTYRALIFVTHAIYLTPKLNKCECQ